MEQNDENVQSCKSVRCCCKLISSCREKPAVAAVATKPRNDCGERAERPQISLCDFLNSQPIPDWIKVNDMRPQQHQSQQRLMKPNKPDNPKGYSVPEDIQSSQIIINFGTVVTNGLCKRDSYQQTDPEVQQRVFPTTVSPPVDRSTSAGPPAKRSMPNSPPADRSTSICPPADRSTSTCPPANRSTSTCPPANRSTSTCPPADRPASFSSAPASKHPSARERSGQEKAPSSSPLKARPEYPAVKNLKCCCNCHSDL